MACALWATPENEAEKACKKLGLTYKRGMLVSGAVVKANYKHDSSIHLYLRDEESPVLVEVTDDGRAAGVQVDGEHFLLLEALVEAADMGAPFSRTGKAGVHENRGSLPDPWNKASRDMLLKAVQVLLDAGALVIAPDVDRSGHPQVLDAPQGAMSLGLPSTLPARASLPRRNKTRYLLLRLASNHLTCRSTQEAFPPRLILT
ncbi:hypothetical protein D0Z66_01395 [Cereibacter sphaeroides]|nr:hypothetical protein D0Z66_01395 [Cereibacter sphaeroides]